MIASESFIETVVERARAYLNDPDVEAKYPDDWIIRHALMPSMVDVMARLNLSTDAPVVCRLSVTPVAGTRFYQLPPCVGEVLELAVYSEQMILLEDVPTRHFLNPFGSNWRLEGSTLVFEPTPTGGQTYSLAYISNGAFYPHLSEDGGTLEVSPTGAHRMWLDRAPDKGALDRRPNAYAGQVLRLLPSADGAVEERVIGESGYEGGRIWCDLRTPFTYTTSGDGLRYEVAPAGHESLYDAISLMVAMRMGTMARLNGSTMKQLETLYRSGLKTIKDNLHTMQQRRPKGWAGDTRDNREYTYLGG
jgi:hypothetical protein